MIEQTPRLRAQSVLNRFEFALMHHRYDEAAAMFSEECYWRDLVAFTWNILTLEGRAAISDMLASQLGFIRPRNFKVLEPDPIVEPDGSELFWIRFETELGWGRGLLRLRGGRIFVLLTTLDALRGYEEKAGRSRPLGARHGASAPGPSWKEERDREEIRLGHFDQPYVVIIGGGQGAIALGARLRQLDVPTIIVERNERPGDSWRNRYKSLCLHDPVWYDHLPYIDFPKTWPVFSPKDKIADWLEFYVKVMELSYWSRSTALRARWSAENKRWTVTVARPEGEVILKPRHLVFATGMSGKPRIPAFPGRERFKGEQHHSAHHPGPDAYRNKRVVVIGSNNSAHDICAALFHAGADVAMVQRSPTTVVRSDTLMELGLGPLYSEEALERGVTTEKADLLSAAVPYRIMHRQQIPIYETIRTRDADLYEDLERAGFLLDWGADGSGLAMKYLRRGSGYYIDVGASQLIIDGAIKLLRGQVVELTRHGVRLDSGHEEPADVVIYATGYGSMNGFVADVIDQETADRVGKVWGLGSDTPGDPGPWEGEQRNMWKPTQQEALWFQGGNLHQARHYSQFLALQLKARFEDLSTPVYGLQPSHHLR